MESSATDVDGRDIRACLSGDDQAYARIVERYEPHVFDQMWRFTRDRRLQEELVQEVFVEVYFSLARFRGKAPLLHWIRRIATRVGYRYWKQADRERRRIAALEQRAIELRSAPETPTPSAAGERLHQYLNLLAPKDRLVLMMHFYDGYGSREIAELIGWSPTLVRVRMHRACLRLRRMLTTE